MNDAFAFCGMRELSDEEISLVAGGDDNMSEFGGGGANEGGGSGPNRLYNPNNQHAMTNDRMYVSSDGYVFADYNRDGKFEKVWSPRGDGTWNLSTDSYTWTYDGDGPEDEYIEHLIETQG